MGGQRRLEPGVLGRGGCAREFPEPLAVRRPITTLATARDTRSALIYIERRKLQRLVPSVQFNSGKTWRVHPGSHSHRVISSPVPRQAASITAALASGRIYPYAGIIHSIRPSRSRILTRGARPWLSNSGSTKGKDSDEECRVCQGHHDLRIRLRCRSMTSPRCCKSEPPAAAKVTLLIRRSFPMFLSGSGAARAARRQLDSQQRTT